MNWIAKNDEQRPDVLKKQDGTKEHRQREKRRACVGGPAPRAIARLAEEEKKTQGEGEKGGGCIVCGYIGNESQRRKHEKGEKVQKKKRHARLRRAAVRRGGFLLIREKGDHKQTRGGSSRPVQRREREEKGKRVAKKGISENGMENKICHDKDHPSPESRQE